MILRGLTLWRPWAASIVHGPKRVENRPWAPGRGLIEAGLWIAIHAGKTWDAAGAIFLSSHWTYAQALHHRRQSEGGGDVELESTWKDFDTMVRQDVVAEGIVGFARVTCAAKLEDLTERQRARHGGFAFGPVCWLLEDVTALPRAIPCRGARGLWPLTSETEAEILNAIRSEMVRR